MEEKKQRKLPKPSGIRPPQIKIAKPSSENTSETIKASKTLHRRSKSVVDLRCNENTTKAMEEAGKVPRFHKPAVLKPLQIKALKRQLLSENTAPGPSNTLARSRRSKSVMDLTKPIPKTTINTQKVTTKRKGDKPGEEVKSKVMKQAKIPDWDYKGRYNQLREMFTSLNEEQKTQKNKLQELINIEEKYSTLKADYDIVVDKCNSLTNNCESTVLENIALKEKIVKLNETVFKLTSDINETKNILKEKLEEIENISQENERLVVERNLMDNRYSNLHENYLQIKMKHEELLDKYSTVTVEHKEKLRENKDLLLNLELSKKQICDLTGQNICLRKDLNNEALLRRKLHDTIQTLKGNIRVYCRIRPPIGEEEERLLCYINFVNEKTIEIRKSRESISAISGRPTDVKAEFTVDKVFEPRSTQEEIFEDVAELIQSALDGYDVCVFAYGQTGSGKTFTMQGEENSEKKGMIPRTVDLIFNNIENLKVAGWHYTICASFLEIYNENVKDLLNPNSNQNLDIRYNEGKGTTVTNLTIEKLNSAEELKSLIQVAQRNRAVAATDFNEHSSRSHAVTKIYLQGRNDELNIEYSGSINLVDLAGSESAKTSSNERLTETKNINKSLSALECVMMALYNKEKHIPYRNSKLTYLLQSSLGGNSKTLMVVNISPLEECFMESVYSLRFASKVKEVKMSARRNKTYSVASTPNPKI